MYYIINAWLYWNSKKLILSPNKTYFLKDVDIENVLVSNMIGSGEKNYKCFIGYLYNDHKVKPSHMMISKASVYVKRYDGQT